MQVQEPSELNADQSYSKLGSDISCNLGSMNVVNHMASPNFGKTVEIAIRALTSVSDNTSIEDVPTIKNGNDRYHSVGLGAMSLAGYFAKNQMEYGSPESIEFTGVYFMLMRYHALKTSNAIAKERGKKFYEFEKSGYANGEFFNDYMKTVRYKEDLSDKVSKLFEGVNIPTKEDWEQLQSDIEEYGLYNAYLLATAP